MSEDRFIEFEDVDFVKILMELKKPVSKEIEDKDLLEKVRCLMNGVPVGLNERRFVRVLKIVNDLDYVKAKIPIDSKEIKMSLQHDVGEKEELKDIFQDIIITLKMTSLPVGILPADFRGLVEPPTRSEYALHLKHLLDELSKSSHIFLITGAGIDPVYLGEDLDRYYRGKNGKNLDGEDVCEEKRWLTVLFTALHLTLAKEYFVTASNISRLVRQLRCISVVTTNWSHSLERHECPNLINLRLFSYDPRSNILIVGKREPKYLLGFIEEERRRNENRPLWLFITGSNLRKSDFGVVLSGLLKEARGVVINNISDRTSYSELFYREYVENQNFSFIGVYESAATLFASLITA